jgi:hypothetical protein
MGGERSAIRTDPCVDGGWLVLAVQVLAVRALAVQDHCGPAGYELDRSRTAGATRIGAGLVRPIAAGRSRRETCCRINV